MLLLTEYQYTVAPHPPCQEQHLHHEGGDGPSLFSEETEQCPVLSGNDTLVVQRPYFLVEGTLPGKLEALVVSHNFVNNLVRDLGQATQSLLGLSFLLLK